MRILPYVAADRRRRHLMQQLARDNGDNGENNRQLVEIRSCSQQLADYRMGVPGPSSNTLGIPIGVCPDNTNCPTEENMDAQPGICIPDEASNYNRIYNNLTLYPLDADAFGEFEETDISKLYPSGGGYDAWTDGLTGVEGTDQGTTTKLWSGCDQDRVGDYDGLASYLWGLLAAENVLESADMICRVAGIDRVNVVLIFLVIPLPAPNQIVCAVGLAALKIVEFAIQTIYDQVNTQNGWIDNAEIQAGYENSINLLEKQCMTFYEAVCRCSTGTNSSLGQNTGGYGVGCDGLDSDCDGDPDNCEEDLYPPEIDVKSTVSACGSGRWFQFESEAIECVENTVSASDDCNGVSTPTVTRKPGTTCADTIFEITVAQERCQEVGNTRTVEQNIYVDDELPPTVICSVGDEGQTQVAIEETGSSVLSEIPFYYYAQDGELDDSCGISNINVTVYANELEDFNAQEMAVFYGTSSADSQKRVYVASGVCANDSNGQCIKDENLSKVRKYTIVVDAEDYAGRSGSAECVVVVVPKNGKNIKQTDIDGSVQRFIVAQVIGAPNGDPNGPPVEALQTT